MACEDIPYRSQHLLLLRWSWHRRWSWWRSMVRMQDGWKQYRVSCR